jgi:hypothetical protein
MAVNLIVLSPGKLQEIHCGTQLSFFDRQGHGVPTQTRQQFS